MSATSWTRRYVLRGIGAATVAAALPCSTIALTAPDGKKGGKISTKDGNLFYWTAGEGRGVPILLIHGGPGGSHLHLTPLAGLGKDRPVVFYDQLDCGESDHPNDHTKWTIDRFVSEIDLVREALGLSEV